MIKPTLVSVICMFLIVVSFTNKVNINFINQKKLIGSWYLNEYYFDGINKVNLEKYLDCEKKETIEFQDSLFKNVTYTSFGPKCFKEIIKSKYKVAIENNYKSKKWETIIKGFYKGRIYDMIIIDLNDSLLKIGTRSNKYEDKFTMIKAYKKGIKAN